MANFTDYWLGLKKGNPTMDEVNGTIKVDVSAFKKELYKAYLAGAKDKAEFAKALKDMSSGASTGLDINGLMKGFFDGR